MLEKEHSSSFILIPTSIDNQLLMHHSAHSQAVIHWELATCQAYTHLFFDLEKHLSDISLKESSTLYAAIHQS